MVAVPPLCEAQVDDGFDLLKSITIDGGYNLGDEARGVSVDSSGNIFLAGYITVPGQGKDIFLARYNEDLVEQDSVTVNGPAYGDDEGYVMAFDGAGYLYLVGYMTETDEGHNAWIGKFDSDLKLVDSTTVAGSEGGDDDAYGILFDQVSGNIYIAGRCGRQVRGPTSGSPSTTPTSKRSSRSPGTDPSAGTPTRPDS